MSKIKVAELFYSLQGEGQYFGTPSIFLRTFGCNFKCAGFGMPRGELSKERMDIDPLKFDKYDDLPLVHTGCDSYASWDPRFKKLSPMMSIPEIVDKMQELLPGGKFSQDKHLIITGGEPLLGWQKSYIDLFQEIAHRDMNLTNVTFETNGTQEIDDDLADYMKKHDNFWGVEVTFSISAKLPSSGEKWKDAIKPDVVQDYFDKVEGTIHYSTGYFKFVVSNEEDYNDVLKAVDAYSKLINEYRVPVYLMPAGGTTKIYNDNERWVADLCVKHGWRYTPRLQVQLWKNAWGT